MSQPVDSEGVSVAKDSFAHDMATAQRRKGEMPTSEANHKLATETLNQIERKRSDRKPAPAPVLDEKPGPVGDELAAKAAEQGFTFTRPDEEAGVKDLKTVDPANVQLFKLLNERVELLLSKRERGPLGQPSWYDRIMNVVAMGMQRHNRRQVTQEMMKVVNDSNLLFGEWWKPKPNRIYVGG